MLFLLVSDFGDFLGDNHGIGGGDLRLPKSTVVERAVVLVAVAVDPAEHTATPADKLVVKIVMVRVMMVKVMMVMVMIVMVMIVMVLIVMTEVVMVTVIKCLFRA